MSDNTATNLSPKALDDLLNLLWETQLKATAYEKLLDDLLNYLLLLEGRPARAARDWQLHAIGVMREALARRRPAAGQRQA